MCVKSVSLSGDAAKSYNNRLTARSNLVFYTYAVYTQTMYLDRSYNPRRRRRGGIPWWPLVLLLLVGIVLYEQRPGWLVPEQLIPTPQPTRGAISFLSEARAAEAASQFDEAIKAYDDASSLEPGNVEPLLAQARLYMIQRDITEARAVAEQAFEIDPENPNVLAALSRALDWQGQYEAAVQYGLDGLDLDPENVFVLAVLGEVYSDVRNWAVAEGYLQTAYSIDPGNVLVLRNLAYLEETRGDYEKAIEYYNEAIALAPNRYDLYIERGRQESIGLNDYEAALASYKKSSEVHRSPVTLDAYGYGLYNMGDNYSAVRELRDAVEMDPENGLAQVHLGMVYYALRNYEDAVAPLETGINLLGESARIEHIYTLGLGHIYRSPDEDDEGNVIEDEVKKCAKALPWLRRALELDEASLPALEGLRLCED